MRQTGLSRFRLARFGVQANAIDIHPQVVIVYGVGHCCHTLQYFQHVVIRIADLYLVYPV